MRNAIALLAVAAVALSAHATASAAAPAASPAAATSADVKAGLDAAAMAKLLVSEHFIKTGQWANDNSTIGFAQPAASPVTIRVVEGGSIRITYTTPEPLSGKSVLFVPRAGEEKGTVQWSCSAKDIAPDLLPSSCK